MKKFIYIVFFSVTALGYSQDSSTSYQKKVLEQVEIETLFSYYTQEGDHGAVGGGLGAENLNDATSTIVINIPIKNNGVFTADIGVSAYSSASSSNVNPFYTYFTGVGENYDDDDDDDDDDDKPSGSGGKSTNAPNTFSGASQANLLNSQPIGTPWYASSGASKNDMLSYVSLNYSQSSEDRNRIVSTNLYASNEYDYTSVGFGIGYTRLFNEKNTEFGIKGKAFLDKWRPIYPTELHEYLTYGSNFLNSGYFNGVSVLNSSGLPSSGYFPSHFTEWSSSNRNSFTLSMGLSQILSTRAQMLIDVDFIYQQGLLSTPYHRIYFSDTPNYYIGLPQYIPNYETYDNIGVFRLADDVERLPSSRVKIPLGSRLNIYLNDTFVLRTFFRYYYDNWGITSKTANFEVPIKLSDSFVITPMYRYYDQTASDYFKPFGEHLSTAEYYTSDYDLSEFNSSQIGVGISYKDIFTQIRFVGFGVKNVDLRYQRYKRSDGLLANFVGFGLKIIAD